MTELFVYNLEVLQERVTELEQFCEFAENIATEIDGLTQNLHMSWEGASAEAQLEFHEKWQRDHDLMLTDVFRLRAVLNAAVKNGVRVQSIHANMWPALPSSDED